jgi:hypothetical protein
MTIQFGINTQGADSTALYAINALSTSLFWQTSTSTGGGGATNEEWLLNIDPSGNPISTTKAVDGSTLSASYALLFARSNLGTYVYPGGAGSWTFQFDGRGTITFTRDITSPSSTTTSPVTLNVTPTDINGGMGIALNPTGISATVTFASGGNTVTWTGSSFSAGVPVAFQNSGGALPSPLVANTVYYVLAAGLGTNSFEIATTAGGSPITFATAGTGTHTGFGDWVRNIRLCETQYLSNLAAGELWNPSYTSKFKGFSPIRFMSIQGTYQSNMQFTVVTFSGSTATSTGSKLTPGMSVTFQVNSGDTLPTPLDIFTTYFVLPGATANTFQVATTIGGSAVSFSGGSGTAYCVTRNVMCDNDQTPSGYLLWGTQTFNGLNPNCRFGGPSIEAMCALCNEQNADMWINIPPLADDSWNTAAATKVLANLNSNLKVYIEKSNEIWSTASNLTGGFAPATGVCVYQTRGHSLFPTSPNSNNDQYLYGLYSSIKGMAIWTSVFGGSASRLCRVFGGQASNDGYSTFFLPTLATDFGGSSSYWTGTAATHYDAVCIGGYMTGSTSGQLPDAWTADSDGGLAKFYQQYNSDTILPNAGAATITTAGGPTAYTITVGGTPSTPPNQMIINAKFNVGSSGAATLAVDGGTAFHIQDKTGANIPATYQGAINTNDVWAIVFTSATTPSTGPGSPGASPGWRIGAWQGIGGAPYPFSGQIAQGLYWASTAKAAYGPGSSFNLRLLSYECGQNFSDFGQPDDVQTAYSIAANRSTQMGTLYTTYFGLFPTYGFNDVVCHYTDVSAAGTQSQWGLLESTNQTGYATVPKYQAYMALVGPPPPPPPSTIPVIPMGQAWM